MWGRGGSMWGGGGGEVACGGGGGWEAACGGGGGGEAARTGVAIWLQYTYMHMYTRTLMH